MTHDNIHSIIKFKIHCKTVYCNHIKCICIIYSKCYTVIAHVVLYNVCVSIVGEIYVALITMTMSPL